MDTLRQELADAGADMSSIVVVVAFDGSNPIIGVSYDRDGWDGSFQNRQVDSADPVLDMEYDGGFGGMRAPRTVAWDNDYLYVQCNLMGASSFERVSLRPRHHYLAKNRGVPLMGDE